MFSLGSPLRDGLDKEAAISIQRFVRGRQSNGTVCAAEHGTGEPVASEIDWITVEPKRPPSAFFLLARELKDAVHDVLSLWADLPESQRSSWLQRAKHLGGVYLAQWEQHKKHCKYKPSIESCHTAGSTSHVPSSSSIEGQRHVPDTVSGHSQMAQLKPHVMKLIRQTGMLGEDLPESEASLLQRRD